MKLKKCFDNEGKNLSKSTWENDSSLIYEKQYSVNRCGPGRSLANNTQFSLKRPVIAFKRILRTINFPISDSHNKTPSMASIYQPVFSHRIKLGELSKSPNDSMKNSNISLLKSKIQTLRRSKRLKPLIREKRDPPYEDILKVNRLIAVSKSERSKLENWKKSDLTLIKLDDITESEDFDYLEAKNIFTNDYLKFQFD